ncbi:CLUMA_CG020922, isoform A [Clunio marinus]|uniref:CLUMA_CG020922, isoform A n=1 Tax=Clunio marinus TaxID=568069 RepID=A0A1J1J6B6_9DIPT|nr:CLUMA_CG020922, isoform A [Clunio marinus]
MSLQGFERETDIEERRKKRQEEWEKVRTGDQPEMAPEEPYDGRSLYDRLKEQRDAKDLEFEESRKFKNMIRGLDDDDVDHLNEIDNRKLLEERKQKEEELKELIDYRAKVAELHESQALSSDQKLHHQVSKPKQKDSLPQPRSSQRNILKSVVKRRSEHADEEPPRQMLKVYQPSALVSAAILPGIGDYKSSDDSDESSELDTVINDKTDLTGRQIRKKKEHE